MSSRTVIGILGQFGNQNLGEEATLATVIANARARYADVELRAFTADPADTRHRHGIAAFSLRRDASDRASAIAPAQAGKSIDVSRLPLLRRALSCVRFIKTIVAEGRFLRSAYRCLDGMQLLVIAGSQQLSDAVGGPWSRPYTLLTWSLMARLRGVKVTFLSVGAGPLRSPLSRLFVRGALLCAAFRSYRDEESQELMARCGVPGMVAPDPVYGIPGTLLPAGRYRRSRVVALNVMPFGWDSSLERAEGRYDAYLGKLAEFVSWLVAERHDVLLVPTHLGSDSSAIADLRRAIRRVHGEDVDRRCTAPPITDLNDLLDALGSADTVVATRFHAILLGCLLRKPVVGLAYHGKSRQLLAHAGQPAFAMNVETFGVEELKACFLEAEAARDAIERDLAARLQTFRRQLHAQYDTVFGVIEALDLPASCVAESATESPAGHAAGY